MSNFPFDLTSVALLLFSFFLFLLLDSDKSIKFPETIIFTPRLVENDSSSILSNENVYKLNSLKNKQTYSDADT